MKTRYISMVLRSSQFIGISILHRVNNNKPSNGQSVLLTLLSGRQSTGHSILKVKVDYFYGSACDVTLANAGFVLNVTTDRQTDTQH